MHVHHDGPRPDQPPPIPLTPRKKKAKALKIVIGVEVMALVALGVFAFVRERDDLRAATESTETTPTGPAVDLVGTFSAVCLGQAVPSAADEASGAPSRILLLRIPVEAGPPQRGVAAAIRRVACVTTVRTNVITCRNPDPAIYGNRPEYQTFGLDITVVLREASTGAEVGSTVLSSPAETCLPDVDPVAGDQNAERYDEGEVFRAASRLDR